MKGDEENALNAGCDGYLAKPIDTRTFVARLLGLIKAANSRQTKIQPPVNEHAN
jgi:DNA-binding response OmpR family regulator